MAIDMNSRRDPSLDTEHFADFVHSGEDVEHRSRLRVKSHQRIRSYREILSDFQEEVEAKKIQDSSKNGTVPNQDSHTEDDRFEGYEDVEPEAGEVQDEIDFWRTPTNSLASSPVSSPRKRREDTVKRSKRFSLPAIALQTTNVTARTTEITGHTSAFSESSTGEPQSGGLSKRFSLVLAGRNSTYMDNSSGKASSDDLTEPSLARGIAAARLSDLLGRQPKS